MSYNQNHIRNGNNNGTMDDQRSEIDAISPRFRTDLNNEEVTCFCFSCKSEFKIRNIHDLMEHYSQPHERFSSFCLYCKTGKVHQYKNDRKGMQYYHSCYRSKMKYDK